MIGEFLEMMKNYLHSINGAFKSRMKGANDGIINKTFTMSSCGAILENLTKNC